MGIAFCRVGCKADAVRAVLRTPRGQGVRPQAWNRPVRWWSVSAGDSGLTAAACCRAAQVAVSPAWSVWRAERELSRLHGQRRWEMWQKTGLM